MTLSESPGSFESGDPRLDKPSKEDRGVIFTAISASKTQDYFVADIGAEVSLMGGKLLERIENDGGKVEVRSLAEPRELSLAVG